VPRTPADVEEFVETTLGQKPQLMVHTGDLPATARALRDLLAGGEYLFDRDVPVKLVQPSDGGPMRAIPLTANTVVIEAHDLCQPVKLNRQGELVAVTLPERVARMYLDMGEWNLQPLAGITTAPVLAADGSIRDVEGYDTETGLWCCRVPKLVVPERPNFEDAQTALRRLRSTFTTFPFADAVRQHDPYLNVDVVDLAEPAGRDESAFLVALLTAICRPSLWLAPGFLIEAPALSGAGTGKGLLVRAICAIAFGIRPRAFNAGHDRQELEKRVAADLVQAAPALFLDNVNGAVLRSDTLATVITERPARVRIFGELRMAVLNSTAFIAITGNGLTVSEDLARRFIDCKLDAGCEDPESRPFGPGLSRKGRARPGSDAVGGSDDLAIRSAKSAEAQTRTDARQFRDLV
jgi:putative DNA primase/helicase